MKPKLKPPITMRLKLKYDKSLFNFAFEFNLRRYKLVGFGRAAEGALPTAAAGHIDRLVPVELRAPPHGVSQSMQQSEAAETAETAEAAPGAAVSAVACGSVVPGSTVQVDPIKPALKAPGSERLKLNMMKCFHRLLSKPTWAATAGALLAFAQRLSGGARGGRAAVHVGRASAVAGSLRH